MLRISVGVSTSLFTIAHSDLLILHRSEQLFQPVRVDRVAMSADDHRQLCFCRLDAQVKGTSKGELFWRDLHQPDTKFYCDLHRAVRGPRIHQDDLHIRHRLLRDPFQQPADMDFLVIGTNDVLTKNRARQTVYVDVPDLFTEVLPVYFDTDRRNTVFLCNRNRIFFNPILKIA